MSNNRSPPSPSNFPFLVVEYADNTAIIGRDTNYQETLASIKKLFSELRNTPDEDIRISAHIEELDRTCRIADGIWSELLPRLSVVQVVVDGLAQSGKPEEEASKTTRSEEPANTETTTNIIVHRRQWPSWSGTVDHTYTTRISLDRTFGQLVEQILRQENITARECLFQYNGAYPPCTTTLS